MIKFIFSADWHWKGANPGNRLGNYKEDLKEKLQETFKEARERQAQAVVMPGDILDTFIVSIPVLLELVDLLNENNDIPVYATFGQHDVQGYNKESIYRTSLALLIRLVPTLHVITESDEPIYLNDEQGHVIQVTFTPYSRQMDVQGYGYSPTGDAATTDLFKVHVAHGTLLDHDPPFDKYTLIEDVVTAADLVLTGDYHPGYGLYKRHDGKIFYNPGSMTRLKASEAEIERRIRIGYIEIDPATKEVNIEDIYLKCQKPGDEILDRSKIEAEKAREYAMGQFSTYIESSLGEKVIIDVNQAIDFIASQEKTEPYIVKAALQILDENREKVVG